jgi:uncharacterized membrane protein YqiK
LAYKKVYVIAPIDEALVRTGGIIWKKKTAIISGGCLVIPGFHQLTPIPLREFCLNFEYTNKLAVRTQDYLRTKMQVTFYVSINPTKDDVLTSAALLSKQNNISERDIKNALEKRADNAIRTAAKKKTLTAIDLDRMEFTDDILHLIQQDLKQLGLTINSIAISEIEESDTYNENNFFDAQGMRLRTEMILRSRKLKSEVELTTEIAIAQQELQAKIQSLDIIKQNEDIKLTHQKEIESLKTQREREIQQAREYNKILQEKAVEIERVQAERELKIVRQEAAIAIAEKERDRFEIEAEKAQAEIAVATAIEVEKAEREKRIATIFAEKEANRRFIDDRNLVEIETFRRQHQAETIRTQADAKHAIIAAKNPLSYPNSTLDLIKVIWSEIAAKMKNQG